MTALSKFWHMVPVALALAAAVVFAASPLRAQAPVQSTDRGHELGKQLMCTCGCGDTAGKCSHPRAALLGAREGAKTKLKEGKEGVRRGRSKQNNLQTFVARDGESPPAPP